jgi:hypothetical protein
MDTLTNGAPPATRQAPSAPGGPESPSASRQPPTASRYTRQAAAAELGLSVDSLRRLQKRAGVAGEVAPRAGGGELVLFTVADVAAMRQARQAPPATRQAPDGLEPPPARRQAPPATRQAPADSSPGPADGWQEALAEARATARRLESERDTLLAQARREADTLRSERDVARVGEQAARREAEEAARALGAAHARLEALRAAWWHWRVLLDGLGPVARLRRRWPDAPAELAAGPLLARPEG